MHISEGYLPLEWCVLWFIISLAVAIYGIKEYRENFSDNKDALLLLVLSGVFAFFVSLFFGLPSVKGSYSHPCATGLTTVFFGPSITALASFVFVFLQAIILGYGGLTTLGANVFSIGVLGPLCGYIIWKELRKRDVNKILSVFLVTLIINIIACITSALQLALVNPSPSVLESFYIYLIIYTFTEILMIIIDCILTTVGFIICLAIFEKLVDKKDLLNTFRW